VIPLRYKIWMQTVISNFLSYTYQLMGYILFKVMSGILYLLLVISEKIYSWCYGHYNAYRNTADFCRSNTYYLRDGYGKRFKIYRRPEFFDPLSCRPSLPPRRQRRFFF